MATDWLPLTWMASPHTDGPPHHRYIFNTEVMHPKGIFNTDSLTTFTHTPSGDKTPFDTIGFIAGGSGITPVLQVRSPLIALDRT